MVVGDVSADRVRATVRATLGKLPRGNHAPAKLKSPTFDQPKTTLVSAKLPTNYIEASFMGPRWSDPLFAASVLGMKILGRRLFEEVRTKRNLSYAPAARYSWASDITRGALYVTAVDINTTMKVMLDEARTMATTQVGPKELAGAKAVFLTSHLMANESTNGQASWLAMCDMIGGDWRLANTMPQHIKAVTAAQIQTFAQRYIRNLQTVVLGKTATADLNLLQSL